MTKCFKELKKYSQFFCLRKATIETRKAEFYLNSASFIELKRPKKIYIYIIICCHRKIISDFPNCLNTVLQRREEEGEVILTIIVCAKKKIVTFKDKI